MDLIDRQAAIDAIETKIKKWNAVDGEGYHVGLGLRYTDVIDTLTDLPSVQPESAERNEESKQNVPNDDLISRKMAIEKFWHSEVELRPTQIDEVMAILKALPSVQPEGYVKIPETGIDDLSDGFHTFRQLYYQRMMLFATIVKQNRDRAWKSLRHEDGEPCFGGGWFIVGIDTPRGSYTYHYEASFYSLFDCKELDYAKHWDGHTEKDVTRLLSLPSAQPEREKGKMTFTLNSPLTDEDWDIINDVELEHTDEITFHTKHGRFVKFIKAQQWIPCSERLPDDGQRVLMQLDIGTICVFDYYANGSTTHLVAWMPLPEPYKGEEHE